MNNKGFTFVELMIAMFIVGVLLLVSMPFYKTLSNQMALTRAATKMVQDLRKTQELAMSAREHDGSIPPGGYGIYIQGMPASAYYIFADLDGDQRYDSSRDELVDTIILESGVQITTVFRNIRSIGFLAPDPIVAFSNPGGRDIGASESITTLSNSSANITVHVNLAGLVYIQ